MPNEEFQELKRLFALNSTERAYIIDRMKDNLTHRNGGNDLYVFEYTRQGVELHISQCVKPEDLFAIDGDMCPLGK